MNLSNEIRKLMIDCDVTITQLAQEISKAKNKHYTVQNLSQKLKNNTLNANEIGIIMDVLDYKILFYPKKS
ncbi:MAG: hypothetical protein K2F57_06555 [Candidatus Gastranaerophilales bacterium]|nr:hypothetical protein [Candidatus Gastranaerophilales bacterium]